LVDDDEFLRRLVSSILVDHRYHVIEVGNGAEALEVASRHTGQIDLLLTDIIMPKLNGVLLAEKILQQRPGMAVLFMSGYVEGSLLSARHPEVALLSKPFRADHLLDAVRAALGPVGG
jgi:CheY-like chemotaxis protein